jgi:phospholipid/cholesterol/gamma-HCH transport system substrate-binding protein
METRTNHVVVGASVIALIAGLVAFIIWAVKADVDKDFDHYHIYFRDSVSGLSTVSQVRYRGVPIGSVTDIRIDPENVELVRVTLEVESGTPIKEDSVATVELQGITGVSIVQISGGSRASPLLAAAPGEPYPVIASKKSRLDALFTDTPQLVNRIMVLVESMTELLDERNRAAIGTTLANVEALTGRLVESSGKIDRFLDNASGTAVELEAAATELNGLARDAREDLAQLTDSTDATMVSARQTMETMNGAAQSITRTSDEIHALVAEARTPLNDFTREGLYETTRLIGEMRTLVAAMSRVLEQLESDPSGFLFGDSQQGYQPE